MFKKNNSSLIDKSKLDNKNGNGHIQETCIHSNYIIEKYGNELNCIFNNYCKFGESLNSKYIKSSSFMKLLRDVGLLIKDNKNDFGLKINFLDKIIIKVATNSNNNKSNYDNINPSNNENQSNIFKKYSPSSLNLKIDFSGFICSIEYITSLLYPNQTNFIESLDNLINKFFIPLNKISIIKNNLPNEKENSPTLVKSFNNKGQNLIFNSKKPLFNL